MGDMNLNLSGSTGIDQSIDYVGKLKLPASAELPINTIGIKIGGKFTAPKITDDTQSIVRQATESAVEKATEKAVEAVGKQLGVDLSDANKQKEELVKVAEQAAQK